MNFIDTHAHLGDAQFDADRDSVFERASAAGVTRIVEIADHPDEWGRAVAIARARPGMARCTLGLHPYYADLFDDAFLPRLRAALDAAPEAVAIGEIGLDYARAEIPHDVQRRAFEALAAAAKSWDVPVVVHCRDAFDDLLSILSTVYGQRPAGRFWGVIHCFTGNPEQARDCLRLGFALGADGPVTYKKNDALREAFRLAGPDATVLETDSPYLPPQSNRGKRNEPAAILEIAAKLAEVWDVPLDEAGRRTSAAAAALYRWP
ncbi:MAG: TatD family hydrolase [Elusimicrobiota bacterium]|nr:TatD family hydrolase [Elusimicrobiota bacterium]